MPAKSAHCAKVVNFGSLNIDYVYQVGHFVEGGETLKASARAVHIGGKGLNQSVALSRAGLAVRHAGIIGADGAFLKAFLEKEGVDASGIRTEASSASGHTVIQVTPDAENAILYFPGTNEHFDEALVSEAIERTEAGDFLVLQNETNCVDLIMAKAVDRGLRVVFNPAPFDDSVPALPLERLHALILNRTEARGLVGETLRDSDAFLEGEAILKALVRKYPQVIHIVTLGKAGFGFAAPGSKAVLLPAYRVEAIDTTGAGDTFTGYAVLALSECVEKGLKPGMPDFVETLGGGLKRAALAAALSVTKSGAAESIPNIAEVEAERLKRGE